MKELLERLQDRDFGGASRDDRVEAIRYLGGLDIGPVVDALSSSWAGSLTDGSPPGDVELAPTIESSLPPELRGALRDEGGAARANRAASIVRARALARAIHDSPASYETMECASAVVHRCDWFTLMDELAEILVGDDWRVALADLPRNVEPYVRLLRDGELAGLEQATTQWATARLAAFPRWRRGMHVPFAEAGPFFALAVLRRLDTSAWIEALEQLPLPSMIEHAIREGAPQRNPEGLVDWISLAPLSISEDGAATGSVTIQVLVQEALDLVFYSLERTETHQRMAGQHDSVDPPTRAEADQIASKWWSEVLEAILSRRDGARVAVEKGCDLLQLLLSGQPMPGRDDRRQNASAALDLLSLRLSQMSDTIELLKGAWEERERDHGRPRVKSLDGSLGVDGLPYWILAVSVEFDRAGLSRYEGPLNGSVAETLWTWMRELSEGSDPGIGAAMRSAETALPIGVAGAVLASLDDPLIAWRASWDALEDNRYESLRSRADKDPSWAPSRYLASVGLHAALHLALRSFDAADPLPLLKAGERAARYIWLRKGEAGEMIYHLGAVGRLLGTEHRGATEAHLTETLGYFMGEVEMCVRGGIVLRENGVTVQALLRAFESASLDLAACIAEVESLPPAKRRHVARDIEEFGAAVRAAGGVREPEQGEGANQ